MLTLMQRLRRAWATFKDVNPPLYAVIYDVPILDEKGEPTGDIREEFYETFSSPGEAWVFFRTAFPAGALNNDAPENARLVEILGDIDDYRGVS